MSRSGLLCPALWSIRQFYRIKCFPFPQQTKPSKIVNGTVVNLLSGAAKAPPFFSPVDWSCPEAGQDSRTHRQAGDPGMWGIQDASILYFSFIPNLTFYLKIFISCVRTHNLTETCIFNVLTYLVYLFILAMPCILCTY